LNVFVGTKKEMDPARNVQGFYLVRYGGNTYWTHLVIDNEEFQ